MDIEKIGLLEAMYMAILEIRALGNKGEEQGLNKEESSIIADLADAIHNIPEAIKNEDYDLQFQLNCMLKGFSERHPNHKGVNPYKVYLNSIEGNGVFTKP